MRTPVVLLPAWLALQAALGAAQDLGRPVSQGRETLTLKHILEEARALTPKGLPGLQWHPEGKRFTYVREIGGGEKALVAESVAGGEPEVLLRARALQAAWKNAKLPGKPPALAELRWRPDGQHLRAFTGKRLFWIRLDPLAVTLKMALPQDSGPFAFTADDRQAAFVRNYNVYVRKADGTVHQVTHQGYRDLTHGVAVSRVEFGIHDGLWWDPQGRRLAFYREDFRPIEPYPYVDFSVRPARLLPGRYPMAGRRGSIVSIGIYDSRTDRLVWLQTDPERDEYLTNVAWGPEGRFLYVAHVNRAQDSMELSQYDAATGARVRTLFVENDEQWVEPENPPFFLPDGSGRFLWLSPRDGYRHFHLYTRLGRHVRCLNEGTFDVVAFKGWGPKGKTVYYETTGPDPRQRHLYRVSVAAGREEALTRGRGQHAVLVGPGGRYFLDVHTSLELPLAVDLLDGEGKVLRRVYTAPNPLARFRLGTQRFFTVKSPGGQTLYGHLIFPPDLDPKRKYPVLHYVYGGPHVQLVQDRWLGGRGRWLLWLHYMAARGYVVFRLDNRGTPYRGIEFEQTIHRRLGTCEVEDQIQGLKYVLGLGFTDPARVGVHGWSYGGFMTLSLMTRAGRYYRCGVSGAPVTDWAYYETGYGERYMDRPEENPEGYRTAAPATHLKGLQGRLLLVQGTADDVVVWQHTLAFLARCVAAGKDVDYFVYPGEKHGLRGKAFAHFLRKMTAFFDRELRPPAAP